MRRVLLFFTAILVAAPMVVSAGGEAESEETYTLTALTYRNPSDPAIELLEQAADEFAAQHPNVDAIEQQQVPRDEMQTRVLQQTLTDDLPDLVEGDNPWIRAWAEAGVYADITEYVEKWEHWDETFPGIRGNLTYDGKAYAVQPATNNIALFYHKPTFKEAGIESPPSTWQELREVSEIIKQELDGVDPIAFSAVDDEEGAWQFQPFLWTNGGSLLELDSEESIEALEFVTSLVEDGYAPRDVLGWAQPDITPYFVSGDLAMMINGPWEIPWQLQQMDEEDYGIAPFPVPEEGLTAITAAGGEAFGIASSTDANKVEAAWEFLRYYNRDESVVEYCDTLKLLPTRPAPLEAFLQKNPQLRVFGEQVEFSVGRPAAGGGDQYPEISSITTKAIQRAIGGSVSPEEAFVEAAQEVRDAFESTAEYERERDNARELLDQLLERME